MYLYVSFFVFFFFLFFSLQCVFKFPSFFNYHFSSFLFRLFATSFFFFVACFLYLEVYIVKCPTDQLQWATYLQILFK